MKDVRLDAVVRRHLGPRGVAAVMVLLVPFLAGCLEPYRVHVDPDVLERAPVEWEVTVGDVEKGGLFGSRSVETRYRHDPDDGPPYPGVLQVFSVRQSDRMSRQELLTHTRELVGEAVKEYEIELDPREDRDGERELRSGVETAWFMREGRTQDASGLFRSESTVRIIGEVGHDGRSSTSFIVVGIAEVSQQQYVPVLGSTRDVEDQRTWINMVGDRDGSVGHATSQIGLIDHLRTHG